MIPRIAMAARPSDDFVLQYAVLELNDSVLAMLTRAEATLRGFEEDRLDLQLMQFACHPDVMMYDHRLSEWIDSFEAWGKEWHNRVISEHMALLPACFAYAKVPAVSQPGVQLNVKRLPLQDPRLSFQFREPFEDRVIDTDGVTLAAIIELYEQPLPRVLPADDYDNKRRIKRRRQQVA